jgi:hypothetical protein
MATSEELKAELAVRELEEKLVAAKDSPNGPSRKLKQEVREARQAHREIREATAAAVAAEVQA